MMDVTRSDAVKWKISFLEVANPRSFILKFIGIMVAGSFLFWVGSMVGRSDGDEFGFMDGCSVFAPEYLCNDALFLRNKENDTPLAHVSAQTPRSGATPAQLTESEWQRMLQVARTCGRLNKERGSDTYLSGSADRISFRYHCLTNDYIGREQ